MDDERNDRGTSPLDALMNLNLYDPTRITEILERPRLRDLPPMKAIPEMHAENVQEAIRNHITGLQNSLKEDQELIVLCSIGLKQIRVMRFGFPNWHVVIMDGHDSDGNPASLVTNINNVQFSCHVVKVEPPGQPYRVGFVPARE